jgi:hypothetical protein
MPLVGSLPDQPPEAVHELAFADDQVSVEAAPIATPLGLDDRVIVGTGAPTGVFTGGPTADAPPVDPHAHKPAAIAHTIANRLTL